MTLDYYIDYFDSYRTLVIKDGSTTIPGKELERRDLQKVIIPDSVTHIGNRAFAVNSIVELIIPNSVTLLGKAKRFYFKQNSRINNS